MKSHNEKDGKKVKFRHAENFNAVIEEFTRKKKELFEGLSETEKADVLQILEEGVARGRLDGELYRRIWAADYRYKPVGIREFVQSEDYFGNTCAHIDKKWKDDLEIVFAPDSKVLQWFTTGALGAGKTTVSMIAMGYKLYLMSCLLDPHSYYGLGPDSTIYFGLYSLTMTKSADTSYSKLRTMIERSPYFRDQYPHDRRTESRIKFANHNIHVIFGSKSFHTIGLDLFSLQIDEGNFFAAKTDEEGKLVGQAYTLYDETHSRLASRFLDAHGNVPGIMLLSSSKATHSSFLPEKIKKEESGYKDGDTGLMGEGRIYVSDYPIWAIRQNTAKTYFQVQVGDRNSRSRILDAGEKGERGHRIIDVPDNYRKYFLTDIEASIRNLAGVATQRISPLITEPESVHRCINASYQHPFRDDIVIADEAEGTQNYPIESFFKLDRIALIDRAWTPKLNPKVGRYIHVDLGITGDAGGMAMVHPAGTYRSQSVNPDGTHSYKSNTYVNLDFAVRIRPAEGGRLSFLKIINFIYYLRQTFIINGVSFDGFQSEGPMQTLRDASIKTKLISVDRSEVPYITLARAFTDRGFLIYNYKPFIDELLDLQRDIVRHKVDHPKNSSKDVADAVCGAYWHCITDPDKDKTTQHRDSDHHRPLNEEALPASELAAVTPQKPAYEFDVEEVIDNIE